MSKKGISAYDNFIIESVEQYLSTVVVIDDRIYENKSGSVASRLTKPPRVRRKAALKSAASKVEKKSESTQDTEDEPLDEVSFHDVQNSFAKEHIICSLYQPQKNASFGEQSDVYKLCSTADVVIVDWDLHGDSGDKATRLVGSLVEQSRIELPYQLRLVLIYTLEVNLQSVAAKIYDDLFGRLSNDTVDVDPQSEGLVLTTENARVVVLGKRLNTPLTEFSDYWVPESDLATRTIKEFSKLASGLLQGIVLRGIANLRKNNQRILMRFNEDLDLAFLTNRALLLPDEAFEQLIPLLTDELHAVLEDTLGESPLGNDSAVKKILGGWCDKHLKITDDGKLNFGDAAKVLKSIKRTCSNEPTKQEKKTLLGDWEADECRERLGSLMSERVRYDNSRRTLHLGVIVRELAETNRYLLCLQPVCDSVRIGREKRAFVFCVLESVEGKSFTHCVIDGRDSVTKLVYKPRIRNISVSKFSGTDAVSTHKDELDRFIFTDEDDNKYEWIAELKTEHGQRAAEQFGRELSRVGLTESEWLRQKAKG